MLGELGIYSTEREAKRKMLRFGSSFYSKCLTLNHQRFLTDLSFVFKIVLVSEYKLPWLKEVPSLLDSSGVFNFILGLVHSLAAFKHIIKQKLRRHVWQEWKKRVAENSVFFFFFFFAIIVYLK